MHLTKPTYSFVSPLPPTDPHRQRGKFPSSRIIFHTSSKQPSQIELDINLDDKVRDDGMSRIHRRRFVRVRIRSYIFLLQITRIKEKVEEQSGVPPPQQRLIFAGRQMYVDHHEIIRFSLLL